MVSFYQIKMVLYSIVFMIISKSVFENEPYLEYTVIDQRGEEDT